MAPEGCDAVGDVGNLGHLGPTFALINAIRFRNDLI